MLPWEIIYQTGGLPTPWYLFSYDLLDQLTSTSKERKGGGIKATPGTGAVESA